MKIRQLKDILTDALNMCDDYEEEDEVVLQSNTYFVKNARFMLGVREGYLDLEKIDVKEEEETDE